jgi:hypothetical protein
LKYLAIAFAVCGSAICGFVAWKELQTAQPRFIELGSLLVLTVTLIVLVWYAYDTNVVARITAKRWAREGILTVGYDISLRGSSVGDVAKTFFSLSNNSPLIVRAKANLNLKVYGNPVSAGKLYDGGERWLMYPHQTSQGWFEVATLLKRQGKTIPVMQAEASDESQRRQLTMTLELTFWDELGDSRTFPPRFHYFDFRRWAWIPSLGEQGEATPALP